MTRRLVAQPADRLSSLYREYLVHKADLVLLRLELAHARHEWLLRKYDANQPRVPAGSSDGGQWTSYGGSWRSAASGYDEFSSRARTPSNPYTEATQVLEAGLTLRDREETPSAPPGVDVDDNILKTLRHRNNMTYRRGGNTWVWLYHQVKPGGPWDYKRRGLQYEDFGNFHYGAVGAAAGFSEDVLLRAAGRVQIDEDRRYGRPPSGQGQAATWVEALLGIGGVAPFGDQPKDQIQISRGVRYYEQRKLQYYRRLGP